MPVVAHANAARRGQQVLRRLRCQGSALGLVEPGRVPVHPLRRHSPQPGRAHFARALRQSGHLDARASGLAAEHGQFACAGRLRGPAARWLPATADRCGPGNVHPGQVRAQEVHGARMGAAAAGRRQLGPRNRRRNGAAEARQEEIRIGHGRSVAEMRPGRRRRCGRCRGDCAAQADDGQPEERATGETGVGLGAGRCVVRLGRSARPDGGRIVAIGQRSRRPSAQRRRPVQQFPERTARKRAGGRGRGQRQRHSGRTGGRLLQSAGAHRNRTRQNDARQHSGAVRPNAQGRPIRPSAAAAAGHHVRPVRRQCEFREFRQCSAGAFCGTANCRFRAVSVDAGGVRRRRRRRCGDIRRLGHAVAVERVRRAQPENEHAQSGQRLGLASGARYLCNFTDYHTHTHTHTSAHINERNIGFIVQSDPEEQTNEKNTRSSVALCGVWSVFVAGRSFFSVLCAGLDSEVRARQY